jgi:hypothetical protein
MKIRMWHHTKVFTYIQLRLFHFFNELLSEVLVRATIGTLVHFNTRHLFLLICGDILTITPHLALCMLARVVNKLHSQRSL